MIKQGLKNFFTSLKYFFTPLGTMFLGMMIGFSVLLPGTVAAVSALITGVEELAANVSLDFAELFNEIWGNVLSLDWNSPASALRTMLTTEWVDEVITGTLQTILGTDFETFTSQIGVLIGDFTFAVTAYVVLFLACWALGFAAGFLLVRAQIRGSIAKRSMLKSIFASIVNAVLATLYVVAAAILTAMWSWSALISVVLMVLLTGSTALFEAYLIHGRGKVTLKQVVNAKNIGLYALTGLIIFAIAIVISIGVCFINTLMGVFVGLTLLLIAATVIGLNAESYVMSAANGLPEAKPADSKDPEEEPKTAPEQPEEKNTEK